MPTRQTMNRNVDVRVRYAVIETLALAVTITAVVAAVFVGSRIDDRQLARTDMSAYRASGLAFAFGVLVALCGVALAIHGRSLRKGIPAGSDHGWEDMVSLDLATICGPIWRFPRSSLRQIMLISGTSAAILLVSGIVLMPFRSLGSDSFPAWLSLLLLSLAGALAALPVTLSYVLRRTYAE
jgi:hypothetical protein